MSENGPREGTRDLPRPGPEAGRRSVDETTAAGAAYGSLSRALRRRRAELAALAGSGDGAQKVADAYNALHPLEPPATPSEVETVMAAARRLGAVRAPVRTESPRSVRR